MLTYVVSLLGVAAVNLILAAAKKQRLELLPVSLFYVYLSCRFFPLIQTKTDVPYGGIALFGAILTTFSYFAINIYLKTSTYRRNYQTTIGWKIVYGFLPLLFLSGLTFFEAVGTQSRADWAIVSVAMHLSLLSLAHLLYCVCRIIGQQL